MPSLSQMSRHDAAVIRLPDHECASSCEITLTRLLSPTMMVGVANVMFGFSMPPNGNDGGSTRMS